MIPFSYQAFNSLDQTEADKIRSAAQGSSEFYDSYQCDFRNFHRDAKDGEIWPIERTSNTFSHGLLFHYVGVLSGYNLKTRDIIPQDMTPGIRSFIIIFKLFPPLFSEELLSTHNNKILTYLRNFYDGKQFVRLFSDVDKRNAQYLEQQVVLSEPFSSWFNALRPFVEKIKSHERIILLGGYFQQLKQVLEYFESQLIILCSEEHPFAEQLLQLILDLDKKIDHVQEVVYNHVRYFFYQIQCFLKEKEYDITAINGQENEFTPNFQPDFDKINISKLAKDIQDSISIVAMRGRLTTTVNSKEVEGQQQPTIEEIYTQIMREIENTPSVEGKKNRFLTILREKANNQGFDPVKFALYLLRDNPNNILAQERHKWRGTLHSHDTMGMKRALDILLATHDNATSSVFEKTPNKLTFFSYDSTVENEFNFKRHGLS